MKERYRAAVESAARTLADHDGNGHVFSTDSGLARQAAESYREQARIAVGSFVTAYHFNATEEAAAA